MNVSPVDLHRPEGVSVRRCDRKKRVSRAGLAWSASKVTHASRVNRAQEVSQVSKRFVRDEQLFREKPHTGDFIHSKNRSKRALAVAKTSLQQRAGIRRRALRLPLRIIPPSVARRAGRLFRAASPLICDIGPRTPTAAS